MLNRLTSLQPPEVSFDSWRRTDELLSSEPSLQALRISLRLERYAQKGVDPYDSRDHMAQRLRYTESPLAWLYREPEKEEKKESAEMDETDMLEMYMSIEGYIEVKL